MTWYQYLLLSLACICYSIKDLQIFGKLDWSRYPTGFWGKDSWVRKYRGLDSPKFFGSNTFLVFLTDGVHLLQMLMKWCLAFGIFNFTLPALYFWLGWTVIQWLTFKICSKS